LELLKNNASFTEDERGVAGIYQQKIDTEAA
jgi:hypothetical protein